MPARFGAIDPNGDRVVLKLSRLDFPNWNACGERCVMVLVGIRAFSEHRSVIGRIVALVGAGRCDLLRIVQKLLDLFRGVGR